MLPSENLRYIISKEINYDLTRFAWGRNLKQEVLKTQLVSNESFENLRDVFTEGLNIGKNILTCKYISSQLPDAEVWIGYFYPLAGYGCSGRGEHAWLVMDGYLIDPTLMIEVPVEISKCIGYDFTFKLNKQSSAIISPDECYLKKDAQKKDKNIAYAKTLYLKNAIPQAI